MARKTPSPLVGEGGGEGKIRLARCTALTRAGQPCKRQAQPGSDLCATHRAAQEREDRQAFYGAPPGEASNAMALAAVLEGVDAEVAMLRVLIRRSATAGDVDGARRAIDSLGRLLKVRQDLAGDRDDEFERSLGRALDVLSLELGKRL